MAVTGTQAYAPSVFSHQESVLNAGVLFSLPALLSQGLSKAFQVYNPLPAGFYGLHHIILMLSFMALCRIKNPEQLKQHPPGELGKLLGLDRVPEVGYFREKIRQITCQEKTGYFHDELFRQWVGEMPELFFYIDGHVRVYHGGKAKLPKRFVSREKLCLSGTTEFWVNDQAGLPLMVMTGELNEKLKVAIEEFILKMITEFNLSHAKGTPIFTLVFDREAYETEWFIKLWKTYQVAIITYRKNVKDKWEEEQFSDHAIEVLNTHVTMRLCEMGTWLPGGWFREVRRLSKNGHQTAILATHPQLSIEIVAGRMFCRWTQENFFKYLVENFAFDRMIEYGTEPVSESLTLVNPKYRQLTYLLKKAREKKRRLEARVYKKMENQGENTIDSVLEGIAVSSDLLEQIKAYEAEIEDLMAKRENVPSRISIRDMPGEERFNKLKGESKKLKNAILMIAYRAETALYNELSSYYRDAQKEGRMLLKEIFTSDADMMPDYKNKQLIIKLHSLSTPRANEAVKKMCTILNDTKTCFPYTDLTMVYKTVAD